MCNVRWTVEVHEGTGASVDWKVSLPVRTIAFMASLSASTAELVALASEALNIAAQAADCIYDEGLDAIWWEPATAPTPIVIVISCVD